MSGAVHDNLGNILAGTPNGDGTFSISGGGGGGGAVTVANGADVTEGTIADAAVSTDAAGTVNAHLRGIVKLLAAGITVAQRALASGTDSVTIVPSGTQAVSAASLPLPAGASTAAKQPALGTAGTPSADVLTVQGATSMTALKVDPSAVTSPVSLASLPALATGTATIGAVNPLTGSLTDRSGTLTLGGTAQQIMAANASRHYLLILNPLSATEIMWVNFTTTAVAGSPSIGLNPGDQLVMESGFVSTEAISVIAATTAHAWTAKEA